MKEIMLPYILIVWLLVKLGVIRWNLRNAVISVAIGALLAFSLFTAHRFWSPADLTGSTTVKAPHAILSPLMGQEIDAIHVEHNQKVRQGELIYTLVAVDTSEEIRALKGEKLATQAEIAAIETRIANDQQNLERLQRLSDFASQASRDDLQAAIEVSRAQIMAQHAKLKSIDAKIKAAQWQNHRREVRAPFDGQVSVTNIASGSRVGAMHLYDTNRKFIEMRVADQAYAFLEPGQFVEFYVNAYPGEIFRGRLHSLSTGTGEASVAPLGGPQSVGRHVVQNRGNHGRTLIIEFEEPEGYDIPIGATGSAWVSANKPHPALGFMDIIGAATVRLQSFKAYLQAL